MNHINEKFGKDAPIKPRYLGEDKIATFEQVVDVVNAALESAHTMKKKVQIAAVSIIIYAGKTVGNSADDEKAIIELAQEMCENLGQGVRGKALMDWFCKYGFVKSYNKDSDDMFSKIKDADIITKGLPEAKKKMWVDFAPKKEFEEWDFKAELKKLLARADKMAKDEEHADKINVDSDLLELAQAMITGQPVKAEGALKLVEKLAA